MNYCNGKLVDLLISSNICRYTEFRAVDKVLTMLNGALDIVPGSRADIFTKKNVSIVEKRLLMKFMTQCMEYDLEESDEKNDFKEFPEDGKFIDLMKHQKLTDNLMHYILYSMCMGNETTTFKEGIGRIRTYLTSIGRYGNTPFLFPMYGCGEIPQCFCRLAAVFGGIYCLGHAVTEVKVVASEEEQVVSFNFDSKTITAKKLVHGLDSNVLETEIPHEFMSRGILITSSPIGGSAVNSDLDGGGVVLLYYPIEGRTDGVTLIQLSHFSGCVPKGLCKFSKILCLLFEFINFSFRRQTSFIFQSRTVTEPRRILNHSSRRFSKKISALRAKMTQSRQFCSQLSSKFHQATKTLIHLQTKADQFTLAAELSWNSTTTSR